MIGIHFSIAFALVTLTLPSLAMTPELRFEQVWNTVRKNSQIIEASHLSLQATDVASRRLARHWFPTVYLEGKSIESDDPGFILFSKLGERNVSGTDFNPAQMNFPSTSRHENATLGVRWAFYEGGLKWSQSQSAKLQNEATRYAHEAQQLQEYARAAQSYGQLVIFIKYRDQLKDMKNLIQATISNYQVGQKSNPLGYSGLLGFKNVLNRINGELLMIETQAQSLLSTFNQTYGLPDQWNPVNISAKEFIKTYIQNKISSADQLSPSMNAKRKISEAMKSSTQAESARFLPQLGLFAEKKLYNNSETTPANSQMIGAYLSWELFSASHIGAIRQSQLNAMAYEKESDAEKTRQLTRRKEIEHTQSALEDQIQLAQTSLTLLEEQTRVAQQLFANGMINALQLAEIYNRRLDLLVAQEQMQIQMIQLSTEQLNYYTIALEEK